MEIPETPTLIGSFAAALQFSTIAPPLVKRLFANQELGNAVAVLPYIGIVLGALLGAAFTGLALVVPPQVAAALTLGLWLLLTGALHFDGWLDSCDGLFGGYTVARRLEIMRDSRVGAFGVAGGGALLLLKFTLLSTLSVPFASLIMAATLGRWAMSVALVAFPYARKQGLGTTMKAHANWLHIAIANVAVLAVLWGFAGLTGLVYLGAASLLMLAFSGLCLRKINGLTGDSYGAICELTEAVVLLCIVALPPTLI